jgi:crotonobetainyl-CoA:carnitine CoA-transferase CaiB-like acyl-CoA transferase
VPDERGWAALCTALGRAEWMGDARFCDAAARARHAGALAAELTTWFATREADACERELIAAGVGCVRADGYASAGAFWARDPHARANGFVRPAEHVVMGPYERWGPVVTLAETPGRYGPAVLAGSHTDALLAELGHDADAIAALRRDGVVWSEEPLQL